MNKEFDKLWELHSTWDKGILIREIRKTKSAKTYLSEINGTYSNFVTPEVDEPEEFNLAEVEQVLAEAGQKFSIYLFEDKQSSGFTEFLVRRGYKLESRDTWLVLDMDLYKKRDINSEIVKVTSDNFVDYRKLLVGVFGEFPGMEKYLDVYLNSIREGTKSSFSDLVSELYLIYDNGNVASGAGVFYSKKGNFAYFHSSRTIKDYRGKGYQTDLIHKRVNVALENGISQIYVVADHGSQSWSNWIKNGFRQIQVTNTFVKN